MFPLAKTTVFAALCVLSASVASAQYPLSPNVYGPHIHQYQAGYSHYDGRANVVRSFGDLIESRSRAYRNYAEGAIAHEQARDHYYDNLLKRQQVRYRLEEGYKLRRQAEFDRKRAAWLRVVARRQAGGTIELTPQDLNYETGEILWPAPLKGAEFAASRQQIETLINQIVSGESGSPEDISRAADEMRELLKQNAIGLPIGEYSAARQFLVRLGHPDQYVASR
ncbi:MAG: hypothetical protein ACREJB_09715 [Planctomycetaceae bacterium]